MIKKCGCCEQEFNHIEEIKKGLITYHDGQLWFNCECGSTLLVHVTYRKEVRFGLETWAIYLDNQEYSCHMSEVSCVCFIKRLVKEYTVK